MQAVRTAGFDTSIANAKAKLAVELYGEEHLGKGAKVREIRKRLLDEFAGYSAIPADIF